MSSLGKKRIPFSKTVVIEYFVQLVDALSKSIRLKGSVATPVLDTSSFNNGDVNVTSDSPYEITGVQSIIVIKCFDPFILSIQDVAGTQVSLLCNGLFIHQGPINKVSITPSGSSSVRVQYIWS